MFLNRPKHKGRTLKVSDVHPCHFNTVLIEAYEVEFKPGCQNLRRFQVGHHVKEVVAEKDSPLSQKDSETNGIPHDASLTLWQLTLVIRISWPTRQTIQWTAYKYISRKIWLWIKEFSNVSVQMLSPSLLMCGTDTIQKQTWAFCLWMSDGICAHYLRTS